MASSVQPKKAPSPQKTGKQAKSAGPKKSDFNNDDLENMAFEAHLAFKVDSTRQTLNDSCANEQDQALLAEIGGTHEKRTVGQAKFIQRSSLDQLVRQEEYLASIESSQVSIMNLYTQFNENSASARILNRALNCDHLVSLCKVDAQRRRAFEKQVQLITRNEESKKPDLIEVPSVFAKELRSIQHIKATLEYKPEIEERKKKVDPTLANMPQPPPGAARIPIEKNPNAHLIAMQTGVSISGGNYLNVGKGDTSNMIPTWQQNKKDPKDFYKEAFGNDPQGQANDRKRDQQDPDWWRQYGDKSYQDQSRSAQYQPPFGGKAPRKDNKFIDQVYSSYGNLENCPDHVKRRISNIVDAHGGDVDMAKLQKHAQKKGWFDEEPQQQHWDKRGGDPRGGGHSGGTDHMRMNEPAGFKSGLRQFKEDMKKQGKNQNFDSYNNNNRYKKNRQEEIESYYSKPKEPEDNRSATDRLFENPGQKSGLAGRRRFVPPNGAGGDKGGTGGNAGFHPGRSVMNHMTNGQKQEEKKDDKDAPLNPHEDDERYKNLDPRMVETIENEIMEKDCQLTWDDIAGLEFAKKTINEIIIWPMLRPDIFKGIRAPPRGIMFFGPPGTGKTLLGKAIACQSKSTFMSISASTLTSKWVGEGEKMVRTMFAIAAIHQPSVVFIDEIDSLLCARSDADQEGSRRIKTEFLVQLDGANTFGSADARILIIGATNRPDDLDEAVRRRLVKRLYIPLPNGAGRRQFIERMIAKEFQADDAMENMIDMSDAEIDKLIEMTKGYSGADLKALSTEAAMMPLREITDVQNCDAGNIRPLKLCDFEEALKNVRMSVNQKDLNKFLEWNDAYGSFPMREEDLKD